ncbi:hypothetical protein E2C01_101263 [Portunus trituberculatus]|uniref:Uncharacterized protein n=1 Tax=Portunus trituberculatus TaxID=210409 RepID=A0A5B7KF61_PORTR|nr:hypothetical protein [Portunus trituberculatus]
MKSPGTGRAVAVAAGSISPGKHSPLFTLGGLKLPPTWSIALHPSARLRVKRRVERGQQGDQVQHNREEEELRAATLHDRKENNKLDEADYSDEQESSRRLQLKTDRQREQANYGP